MLELGINGYTRQEVIDQLHGKRGSRGLVKIRYDLLNRQDVKLGELAVQSGRVSMNSLAEIKRTASFELTEQEAQDVDWLNDRIRPVFCLKMPEIRKTYKAWGKIDASFSRSSIAYLSDGTQVAANQPRFEQGKFGKAIMVEEGTTNLLQNPSFETGDFTKWYLFKEYGGATYEITSEKAWHGSYSVKITTDGTASSGVGIFQSMASATAGVTYTFSVRLAGTLGANKVYLVLRCLTADGTIIKDNIFYISEAMPQTFKTYSATTTAPENTAKMEVHVRIVKDAVGVIYIDAAQLEQKPYPTSFIDDTRSPEILTIPTAGVLSPQEGTVECWINLRAWVNGISNNGVWSLTGSTRLDMWFSESNSNCLGVYDGTAWLNSGVASSSFVDSWHYIAYTWGSFGQKIYVDGVLKASTTRLISSAHIGSLLYIGSYRGIYQAQSLIDDLRISSRARSDAEILAAYQRNKLHLIDQWTTAKFSFDDKLSGDYFTLVVERDISAQWIEWPLGVFLLSSPTRKDENRQVRRSIEAYDSSLILKEDKFTDRHTIPAGTKYTDAVIDILNGAGIWKINILDHPGTLAADREFEIGATKLTAVNELLAAINYTSLWVDENGYFVAQPYVLPSGRDPEYEYRTGDLSIIHPGAEEELDLFAVPNKFVRYVSNPDRAVILRSEYTNDLSTSPTSTINRGRTIVDIDSVDDIYDQATLDEYVKRIAYNASQIYGKFEFSTALMPHHSYYNCLFVEYDPLGISHKYIESSWTMDLHANGVMTHSCRRVIQI